VAGVPPDAYSDTGQLWGNPLYDWPALRRRGYRWWTERFRRTFELFDLVRVDHFRGFVAYWAVPAGAETAMEGRWQRGPGRAVFDAATEQLGELAVVAEDLGDITPPVTELRRALGFPGMAVLQFAFNPDDLERGTHEPHNHEVHQVVYTGTHDNDTVVGWWAELPEARRQAARDAFAAAGVQAGDDEVNWQMIELALASRAGLAMMQAQDVLGLGSEARMNVPGTAAGSWRWRMRDGALTSGHAERLRSLTRAAGRA
jgi:4-alpha-glucanotransferase